MIDEYKKLQTRISERLGKLGFSCVSDSDFESIFQNGAKTVIFEGDRYNRPVFLLYVASAPQAQRYTIWLLMQIFDPGAKASPNNQLKFIETNEESIFAEHPAFDRAYAELNKIEY